VTGELDRRALATLGVGHLCADMCQGAVPALLPFLAAAHGWSYTQLGSLVLAMAIGSSLVQPLFGLASDRVSQLWLLPAGVLVAGAGVAAAGIAPSYPTTVAAIALSGLGVAAFHPEGARFAGLASGARPGRGMSLFSVGGNTGFAVGPLLCTPLVLVFGLAGTLGLIVPTAAMAWLLRRELPRMRGLRAERGEAAAAGAGADRWGPFAALAGVVSLRSGVYFGLQSFVPLWFVAALGASEALGNAALTAMLVAGALGTLAGGALVDRIGPRAVLVGTLCASVPMLVAFPLVGPAPALVLLAAIGLVTIASFSVTVILGQQYLPNRLGLASGVTLGLAIGVGGLMAGALGAVADAYGLEAVLWIIAVLPLPAVALAFVLPREHATLGVKPREVPATVRAEMHPS
jgi:FSR family fosmidomycin resistance protein-like MFS transporter